jgi:DNA polymerase I-like protein with 3'-5' exonuclease and polymerase domains
VRFFATLYNVNDMSLNGSVYSREGVLSRFYQNGKIRTPTGRSIKVDQRKALNYLIQSTTSDLTLERAVALDEALKGRKSKIAFVVHDEIVIDLADEDKEMVLELKTIFENNKLGKFMANVKAGKDYGNLKELKI